MQQKAFTLINRGMNRDLSISKAGESSAYENHNIRIMARDNDTTLSVTNERGTKEISLDGVGILGTLLGWNVLNQYLILFTHEDGVDRIYRLEYADEALSSTLLVEKDLGFDLDHPIESIVDHETDLIQKIYWVDGKNVLRFMNFMASDEERAGWDETTFDVNKSVSFDVEVKITKDNSGNTRPNGTVQYFITYFNKHGQESGLVWVSDLVYLSPLGNGGAVDGTNNNRVTLTITNFDQSFSHFRVYSIVRTSFNGQPQGYIVGEGSTSQDAVVIDDGSHLTAIDSSSLLYVGSQDVRPGTLAQKDQTLFLGNLNSVGRPNLDNLESVIQTMYDSKGISLNITFERDSDSVSYPKDTGAYPYDNQLKHTSSQILSFKGNEKYRFGLIFRRADGTLSDAFWIGDAVNPIYPKVESDGIHRVIARCTLPETVITEAKKAGFETVQLAIAEATYADRSVKAQGIISPTVFNSWNRYKGGLYSYSSWITRTRGSEFAHRHFEPLHNSTSITGELECNYWATDTAPSPYYQLNLGDNPSYVEKYDGMIEDTHMNIAISLMYRSGYRYRITAVTGRATQAGGASALIQHSFQASDLPEYDPYSLFDEVTNDYGSYELTIRYMDYWIESGKFEATYASVLTMLDAMGIPKHYLVKDTLFSWCQRVESDRRTEYVFNVNRPNSFYHDTEAEKNGRLFDSLNDNNFFKINTTREESSWGYVPAYYSKHLMFVDENIVTLNSPELEYEALSVDEVSDLKLRIVGVAKITGKYSDYIVEANPGKLPGENLVSESIDSVSSYPLWQEYGLIDRQYYEGSDNEYPKKEDITKRTSYDYLWGSNTVRYWLHMWNHSGKISGYTDYQNEDYSLLRRKVFANLRYAYETIYTDTPCTYSVDTRYFNYTSSQYVGIPVDNETKYYNAIVQESLSLPGSHKYPIIFSSGNITENSVPWDAYLYSSSPIAVEYSSTPHAVLSLGTRFQNSVYTQTILPAVLESDVISSPEPSSIKTGWLLPWINPSDQSIPYIRYKLDQSPLLIPDRPIKEGDEYVFIGELYLDYTDRADTRYGGTSAAAVKANRFIAAGPQYILSKFSLQSELIADRGDTYFQRWDCLKTKPYSTGSVNNVIDVTSVLVETHINIDGRSDKLRGTKFLASIDPEKFGELNSAYSQQDNFTVRRDLDEDFNLDVYHSTVTWTLPKTESADVDEWTHITLANTLKLDGDKGSCTALRRFQNSIIAFQDRSIAEILFNSRTQLTTTDGVPVEIANSGKVEGKRYISNKFGCLNKWSIVEGKSALYFVDNINKAFCSFTGQGIDSLSSRLGFDVWFRQSNSMKPWTPKMFENLVAYYDRIHSDIYLVRGTDDEMSCLVFNEKLGSFSSFFDYGNVPMMTNVEDKFISFKNHKLWFQNEGLYGDFFGDYKDYWVQYRITPDPFGDKIWSGFDYRADFYRILNPDGDLVVPEEYIINGDQYGLINDLYVESETFDTFKIWNEYQSTGEVDMFRNNAMDKPVTKDFRIWRRQIPRAEILGTNKYGLDRIRNPWINLQLKKTQSDDSCQDLMQLHDVVVRYFE